MSTTKVLHVIARMNVGGTAKYVGDLVALIPNSELATGYIQGEEIEDSIVEKLPIHRLEHLGRRISLINDFKAWIELRRLIKEVKPNILHTHTFKAGLIGRLIGGDHKKIHTFHGHLFNDQSFSNLEKQIITLAERFLARRTDLLISVGKRVGVELRAVGVGPSQEWISIPPGVTPLSTIDKGDARRFLGLEKGQVLIGWMARMAEVKNPFLLLEVAKRMPTSNFVMAGGGNLLEQIQREAPDNVNVIGWTDPAVFWSSIDLAISTSDNEGIPIALIEAQLAGVPVVATDAGSTNEIVQDGLTGFITSKDVEFLVGALQRFISDPDLILKFAANAREYAAKTFTVEKMIDTHIRIYNSDL